jgi:hypothetical protein
MFTDRSLELDFILNISGAFLSAFGGFLLTQFKDFLSYLRHTVNYVLKENIIKLLLHTLYIVWLQELGPEVIKVFILPHISSLAQKIDIGTRPLSPHIMYSFHSTHPSKIWICAGILEQSMGG